MKNSATIEECEFIANAIKAALNQPSNPSLQHVAGYHPSQQSTPPGRRSRQPWKRGANTSFAEPSAGSSVARSLLTAKPSPFRAPRVPGDGTNPAITDLTWDEEGEWYHWPVDDESLFYRRKKDLASSAESTGRKGFYDLNITMPIILPGAPEIRVISGEGENYYNLSRTDPSAHLIFGFNEPAGTATDGTGSSAGANEEFATGSSPTSPPTKLNSSDDPSFSVRQPQNLDPQNTTPAVCDVWASFLNVHLGTIRNCRPDQVSEVARFFKKAMCEATAIGGPTVFDQPIHIDCRGIYAVTPEEGNRGSGEQYSCLETRAYFHSEADVQIFRNIRRRLKYLLLLLLDRFGVGGHGPSFDVGLTENCRTSTGTSMSIEVRRYSPLTDQSLITALNLGDPTGCPGSISYRGQVIPVKASAVIQEVRLEMTHARTVDPRWAFQWVLARRMPAHPEGPKRFPNMARYVFSPSVQVPTVVYEIDKPRDSLLKSRYGPLYHLHAKNPLATPAALGLDYIRAPAPPFATPPSQSPTSTKAPVARPAAEEEQQKQQAANKAEKTAANLQETANKNTSTSRLSAEAVPFFPLDSIKDLLDYKDIAAAVQQHAPEVANGHQQAGQQQGLSFRQLVSFLAGGDTESSTSDATNTFSTGINPGATLLANLVKPGVQAAPAARGMYGGSSNWASSANY